ncbi:PilZ domain-containing protein [Acetitomaculum ruminis DSM 5522]|uniref:PilZ domain-containing protein n=1 Tax=Acetitomaculum ruminis DSM 5522 TaxID=1120918 RepID=A0A1I0VM29_9FIRM|nr:PilZ domain-containing protein [Acetitomaculum ruminis]SFA77351.1 PilZ domain-containing protein [Acetitomaculum ruminis DSM 5522]
MEIVKINEIPVGSTIMVCFYMKTQYSFHSKVLYHSKYGTIITPIRVNKSVLNFDGSKLKISVMWSRKNSTPVIWRNCRLKLVMYKGHKLYLLRTIGNGASENRRANFRVPVSKKCEISMAYKSVYDGVVTDISDSGMGVISNRDTDKSAMGSKVRVAFKDVPFNYIFVLSGEIIREKQLREDRVFYGIQFTKNYPNLATYCSLKQREILFSNSNNKRKFDYTPFKNVVTKIS